MRPESRCSLIALWMCAVGCGAKLDAAQFISTGGVALGGTVSKGTALSDDGTTIVGWMVAPENEGHVEAFRWTLATGIHQLRPNSPSAYTTSMPFDVSADGTVVVGVQDDAEADGAEAFRWTLADGFQGLGFLAPVPNTPDDVNKSRARAVSPDGKTIFGESTFSDGFLYPFRWTLPTGMQVFNRNVADVSADGATEVGTYGQEAYRWNATDGLQLLGDLPGGAVESTGIAVAPDGRTVVGSSSSSSATPEAFRWSAAGGMEGLGRFESASPFSIAHAVAPSGNVVFGRSIDGGAFIWDPSNGIRSLRAVLTAEFGLAATLNDWFLTDVYGVSSDGRAIAGNGINPDGNLEAWLVRLDRPIDVPEPAGALLLIAIVTAAVLACRGRRSGPQTGH